MENDTKKKFGCLIKFMRISVISVGKIVKSPEAQLVQRYEERFNNIAGTIGLKPLHSYEVDERKFASPKAQALKISKLVKKNSIVYLLDERGKAFSSDEFSSLVVDSRDNGIQNLVFVIGGSCGLNKGNFTLVLDVISLGKMVWPHLFARVMLFEQIYRAASIIKGLPYHKR